MAYAALGSLAQTLNQILNQEQCRALIDHDQLTVQTIQSLQENVCFLKSFLNDFPHKETVKLEGRIRDAAYEAEDIVQNFIVTELRRKIYCCSKELNIANFLKAICLPCHGEFPFHDNWEQFFRGLQDVSEKIDRIVEEVKEIEIGPGIEDTAQPALGGSADGTSSSRLGHGDKDVMVGFEDQLMAVQLRICGDSAKREVIPIVGMGGSGKTTLARHLYNDKLMLETFDFCGWATISQEYQVKHALQQLLSIEGTSNRDTAEFLVEKLYKSLKGRKYLIILDDMWDGEAWDAVRRAFPDDNNGSRIILTTREAEVASYVDCSAPLNQMHLLDDDQSWDLLHKKVFGEGSCPHELKKIGMSISNKCKGLPLAIVVIAGVLAADKTVDHWKYVATNMMETLSDSSGNDIFEILSLSYTNLPYHLKSCFLYAGAGFPEDHKINVRKLIWLWMAEGFIESNGCSWTPEEVAEQYLADLIKRNLILVVSRRYYDGKVEYCIVHDVLREWCMRRAGEDRFFIHKILEYYRRPQSETKNQRRISTSVCTLGLSKLEDTYEPQIRTIMFFNYDEPLMGSVGRHRLLRVLETESTKIYELLPPMTDVPKLFQLRYLSLSAFRKKLVLPGSISRLFNLQTLIVASLYGGDLPKEIWGMRQLRHILFTTSGFFLPSPSLAGKATSDHKGFLLEQLQTLSKLENPTCIPEIVNLMPNLQELGLVYYFDLIDREIVMYQLNNLEAIPQLKSLSLYFSLYSTSRESIGWNATFVSNKFSFPSTLTFLRLKGCRFPWKSVAFVGSLPNLEVLELERDAFVGGVWETRDGEFCRLRVLKMWDLDLYTWEVEECTHFPCLERLFIQYCSKLDNIPYSFGEISSLELIQVYACCESTEKSALKIQEEQQYLGNDIDVDFEYWSMDSVNSSMSPHPQ